MRNPEDYNEYEGDMIDDEYTGDPAFAGDVAPARPISTIIFSRKEGNLRTDTGRRVAPLAFAHNYYDALLGAPHDTMRVPVAGAAANTTITLNLAALGATPTGKVIVPFILIKLTTQSQFQVASGGVIANVVGETESGIAFVGGPYDILRGGVLTNFAVIPYVLLEAGKYAVPVNGIVDADTSIVVTLAGTTINDAIEILIPGPGSVEALAILDSMGLKGLAMRPGQY